MSAIIDTLKNKLGVLVYPKTLTKAVYDETTQDRLDNTLGSATLTTTSQNLKGAINELDGEIGNITLTTTSQNLKGAINEVNAKSIAGTSPITATTVGSVTTITHNTSGATAGTYKSLTVDNKGHVTGGTNPTTLVGYGITDATPSSHIGTGGTSHAVATTSVNGFMSSTDKTKLDGINTLATRTKIVSGNISDTGTGSWITHTVSFGVTFLESEPFVSFNWTSGASSENFWLTTLSSTGMTFSIYTATVGFSYNFKWQVIGNIV